MPSYDSWGRPVGGGGGGGGYDSWGRPISGGGGGTAAPSNHFVGRYTANPNLQHAGGSLVGNLFGQAENLISGIPTVVASLPGTTRHTLEQGYKTTGAPGWSPSANLHEVMAELGIGKSKLHVVVDPTVPKSERGLGGYLSSEFWHDPRTLGGQVYTQPAADVVALRRGDWHYFQQHPLNPILDIATVASLGGGAALNEARLGTLGERAQELATTERLLKDGNHKEALNQSRTLQGRIRQRAYDQWSMNHPDNPLFGGPARMKRILDRRVNTEMIRAHLPLRVFQRATRLLDAPELFAFHVAVEGVPLDERIAYYTAREQEILATLSKRAANRAKRSTKPRYTRTPLRVRPIQQYLANLKSPAVQEALLNPRQEFIDALWTGAQVEGEAGRRLVQADMLSPTTRTDRALLPTREMTPPAPAPGTLGGPPLTPGLPPKPLAPMPSMGGATAEAAARTEPLREPVSVPEPVVGRQLGEEPPRGAPEPIPHEGPVTFLMNLPKGHYYKAEQRGLDIGTVTAKRGDRVTVRLTEEQLKTLYADAKVKGSGPSGAALRRSIDRQRKVMHEAMDKAVQKLPFKRHPDGSYTVEGTDYHISYGAEGRLIAHTSEGVIGEYRTVAEAKRSIERSIAYQRREAVNAAASSDPFLSAVAGDQPMAYARPAGEVAVEQKVTPEKAAQTALAEFEGTDAEMATANSAWEKLKKRKISRLTAAEKKVVNDALNQKAMYDAKNAPPPEPGPIYRDPTTLQIGGRLFHRREDGGWRYPFTNKNGKKIMRRVSAKEQVQINEALAREAAPKVEPIKPEEEPPVTSTGAASERRTVPPPAPPGGTAHDVEPFAGTFNYELPPRSAAEAAAVGPNRVNPLFPAPYRFPHVRQGVAAGQFMSPKTESALGLNTPLKQLRHNAAYLLSNALMITDPERVISRDYLSTMRHLMIGKMQDSLDKIAHDPELDLRHSGYKRPQDWYYRPSKGRASTAPLPEGVALEQGLTQDRALVSSAEGDKRLEDAANGIVTKRLKDFGIDEHDIHAYEKMKKDGIKVIHAAYGKDFRAEFKGTHWAIRAFYDRPLAVWRAITLNYRPAWLVNNFVGNGIMGLATYGPAGAEAYLRVLLTTERGEDKVIRLRNYTMRIPTLRRKFGRVFDDVAPEIHSAGLFGTQTKIPHLGYHEGKVAAIMANPAIRALGFVPKKVGQGVIAVGRGITRAEVMLAEDTGREAAFLVESGGDIQRIRDLAAKAGEANLSYEEALRRMDRPSVERAVTRINDVVGDFNDLSHFERAYVRRLIPFYSWYKVITKVSAKYAARYPARLLLMKNIADANRTTGEPLLPSWLEGALLLGGPSRAGNQALVSTQGLNPYETLNQVPANPWSVFTPALNATVTAASGNDPTFGPGQGYYGPGDKSSGPLGYLERFAGSAGEGLGPTRLYQQTTRPYTGKLYAPHTYGHVGPVSVNDFLLQYLGVPLRHVNLAEARRERGLRR